MKDETAKLIVKFTEQKLKEDPNYETLSDQGKSICLLLGSCLVISKLVDGIAKGVKEFYEKYH